MSDRFGIQAEKKILESRVRDVFTPHRPVDDVDLLFGRSQEVKSIIQQINTPGQHALLYGERGVGKSSLANVAADLLLNLLAEKLYKSRCDATSTFEAILRAPLFDAGVDIELMEQTITEEAQSSHGANLKVVERKGGKSSGSTRVFRPAVPMAPARAAELLSPLGGLLLIDELDSIQLEEKQRLAQLIKLLSDSGSEFKILCVGIAETAEELTGGHPSVARCLKETRVPRMGDEGLRDIVTGGAARVGISFTEPAIKAVVAASSGYPHFTHLLCLKAAEVAIIESRQEIDKDHIRQAMQDAVTDAEGTLKRTYDTAVRSYGTDMYRRIVLAASNLTHVDSLEFTASDLRSAIEELTGEPITQNSLNNHFQRLVSVDGSTILLRMAKGVYRFTDPRMPSFVRIANGIIP